MKSGEAPHRLNFSCLHTPTQSPLKVGGRWLLCVCVCVEVILNRRGGGVLVPNFKLCKTREEDTWWQNVENDFSCSLFFIFDLIQQKKHWEALDAVSLTELTLYHLHYILHQAFTEKEQESILTHRTKCHYLHLISIFYNTLVHIIKWMRLFGKTLKLSLELLLCYFILFKIGSIFPKLRACLPSST